MDDYLPKHVLFWPWAILIGGPLCIVF